MKKSYLAVALTALASCSLTVSVAEAQKTKQTETDKSVKVVREGVGFDGLRVGQSTEADVIKKFGRNYKLKTHKKYSYQMIYPNGVSFYICQSDKRRQIFDIELRAPFEARTMKGITLGKSTLEDIYKIYGRKPLRADKMPDLQYRGVSFYYQRIRGRNVVTVIDIVENSGIRQCDEIKAEKKNK